MKRRVYYLSWLNQLQVFVVSIIHKRVISKNSLIKIIFPRRGDCDTFIPHSTTPDYVDQGVATKWDRNPYSVTYAHVQETLFAVVKATDFRHNWYPNLYAGVSIQNVLS